MNNGGQTASLSSVPNALSRWTEETRVLEADSMHDAVTGKLNGASPLDLNRQYIYAAFTIFFDI